MWDYLRGIDYLASRSDVDAQNIQAAGVGTATLVPLFAAVLDERIAGVVVDRGLSDLRCVVESQDYKLPTQWFVPGILARLDLPDAVVALGKRSCRIVNPVGANGEPLNESAVRTRYGGARNLDLLVGPDWNWLAALRKGLNGDPGKSG